MNSCFGTHLRPWLSFILSTCIVGCTSTRAVESGEELDPTNQRIRVHLQDQRVINFWPEKYTINPSRDSVYITGVGLETRPERSGERKYEGSITHQEIQHIEIVEQTKFTKIMLPVALTFMALAVVTAILALTVEIDYN